MEHADIGGVSLAYECGGSGSECSVLLNGIAMSMAHWRPVAELMGSGRRIILNDLRGQLHSDKPAEDYSLELHARDLALLVDRLGTGPVHVVGTSYGSEVGLVFARLYADRCRSLVVIDGASEVGPLLRAAVYSWRTAALADPLAFYRALVPWTYSERYIRENQALLDSRERAVAGLPGGYFEAFVRLCDSFLAMNETEHLSQIGCPTLVLVGSEDILKPIRYAQIIAGGIPGAELRVLPGLGHGSVIEDPKTVFEAIQSFYGRCDGR